MWKTERAISELISSQSNINSVRKNQIKTLLKKTMEDIRKSQKGHEEDRKQIKMLTSEKQKLNQILQFFFEENRALKELAKMPVNDEMARSVAEGELAKKKLLELIIRKNILNNNNNNNNKKKDIA